MQSFMEMTLSVPKSHIFDITKCQCNFAAPFQCKIFPHMQLSKTDSPKNVSLFEYLLNKVGLILSCHKESHPWDPGDGIHWDFWELAGFSIFRLSYAYKKVNLCTNRSYDWKKIVVLTPDKLYDLENLVLWSLKNLKSCLSRFQRWKILYQDPGIPGKILGQPCSRKPRRYGIMAASRSKWGNWRISRRMNSVSQATRSLQDLIERSVDVESSSLWADNLDGLSLLAGNSGWHGDTELYDKSNHATLANVAGSYSPFLSYGMMRIRRRGKNSLTFKSHCTVQAKKCGLNALTQLTC